MSVVCDCHSQVGRLQDTEKSLALCWLEQKFVGKKKEGGASSIYLPEGPIISPAQEDNKTPGQLLRSIDNHLLEHKPLYI